MVDIAKKPDLTQHGLNTVLFKMIAEQGGKYVVKRGELELITNCCLGVEYDRASDSFCIRIGQVKKSPIIGGSEVILKQ